MPGRILAICGFSLGTAFDELVLDLADGPRVLFAPSPAGDPERAILDLL